MNIEERLEKVIDTLISCYWSPESASIISDRCIYDLKLNKIATLTETSQDEGNCYFCNSKTYMKYVIDNTYVCAQCGQRHRIFEIQYPPFVVNLTYFKPSGKFYSSGSYETNFSSLLDIHQECLDKLKHGDWPDLFPGKHEFNILVRVENHPMDYPYMIMNSNLV